MKITIVAPGSTGDVRPCILLAGSLIRRGHSVTIIAYDIFEEEVKQCGAGFASFPGDVNKLMGIATNPSMGPFKLMNSLKSLLTESKDDFERVLSENIKDSDAVIFTMMACMAVYIAEKYKVPYARLNYYPDMECSTFTQHIYPKLILPKPVKRVYNRMALKISYDLQLGIFKSVFGDWAKKFNLPKTKFFYNRSDGKPVDQIMVYSEHVIARPPEYKDNVHICGYIFEDLNNTDYVPDEKLIKFLEDGPPPVYIGFGSMDDGNFDRMREIILKALKKTGKRAVISKGWGGFSEDSLPDSIFMVDYCPHDWLFPRMSGIVHHGGAGTTAAALRAGKPTLLIPFGADQKFWGDRIVEIGCGPKYIMRKHLTVRNLAKALNELDSPVYNNNAVRISKLINAENGVGNVCDCIEQMAVCGFSEACKKLRGEKVLEINKEAILNS